MTKETKIGLLVGMGVIILIGILISDHLSAMRSLSDSGVIRLAACDCTAHRSCRVWMDWL